MASAMAASTAAVSPARQVKMNAKIRPAMSATSRRRFQIRIRESAIRSPKCSRSALRPGSSGPELTDPPESTGSGPAVIASRRSGGAVAPGGPPAADGTGGG